MSERGLLIALFSVLFTLFVVLTGRKLFKSLFNWFNWYYINAKFLIVIWFVVTVLLILVISQDSVIETYFPPNSYIETFALTAQHMLKSFEGWYYKFKFWLCVEDSLCSDFKIITGWVIELATPYWESFKVWIWQEDSLLSKILSNVGDVITTISEKWNKDRVEMDFSKIPDPVSFLWNLVLVVRDFIKWLFSWK